MTAAFPYRHTTRIRIRPEGARKTRPGRRVVVSEELGRRHRVVVATTSYEVNAFRQPLLRLQTTNNTPDKNRAPRTTHGPHKLFLEEPENKNWNCSPNFVAVAGATTIPRPTTNGHPTAIPRQKIARTCTSIARRSAGIDNSKILGFTDRTKNLPVS